MNFRRNQRVLTEKAAFIFMQTVNCHDRITSLYRSPGAALTHRYLDPLDTGIIKTIMSHDIEILFLNVQLKNARAFSSTELDRLGRDNLQHTIQFESRGYYSGDTVNGSQFMHFASKLFIGLLIESPIFAINGNNTSDDLNKILLPRGEVSRYKRLDADYTDQTFNCTEENNRHR